MFILVEICPVKQHGKDFIFITSKDEETVLKRLDVWAQKNNYKIGGGPSDMTKTLQIRPTTNDCANLRILNVIQAIDNLGLGYSLTNMFQFDNQTQANADAAEEETKTFRLIFKAAQDEYTENKENEAIKKVHALESDSLQPPVQGIKDKDQTDKPRFLQQRETTVEGSASSNASASDSSLGSPKCNATVSNTNSKKTKGNGQKKGKFRLMENIGAVKVPADI